MCNRELVERFKQIFDEYRNLPDGAGSRKTLVSTLINLLFAILIKLLVIVVNKTMED